MRLFIRGCLLAVAVFGFLWGCSSSERWSFPRKIDGYHLIQLITGDKALAQINKLHGKHIRALKGAIAVYGKGEKRAMVWVSLAPSPQVALQQVRIMLEKMEEGGLFYGFSMNRMNNVLIYHFLGLGQEHYLFAHRASVFWISAPMEEGRPFAMVFVKECVSPL